MTLHVMSGSIRNSWALSSVTRVRVPAIIASTVLPIESAGWNDDATRHLRSSLFNVHGRTEEE
jgi:hypothetical protein